MKLVSSLTILALILVGVTAAGPIPNSNFLPIARYDKTSTPTRTPTATPTRPGQPTATHTPTATPTATVPTGPCPCNADTRNCSDFGSQASAQTCYDWCVSQGAGDIHRLDFDHDGEACESLPRFNKVLR